MAAPAKKIPLRKCTGCQEMKQKKDMMRVLRTAEGDIVLDTTGRKNGRGAYLCRSMSCFEQAVKNTGNDFYVGFWRYFDRNTDDSRFELGGKYTIALVPTDSGYDILYNSGANRFSSYWSPYMKKGALVRTPFYNQYEIHWFTADKNLYFDECYASVSEDILTLHFPIQQSTVRFYRFTPSSENP